MERCRDTEQAVPHSCVVGKNWEGYLRSEGYQTQTGPPSPAFQYQKISPDNFWL